jgi:hypothetical protein
MWTTTLLMFPSTMLASKVLDDRNCRNVYYANTGGEVLATLQPNRLSSVLVLFEGAPGIQRAAVSLRCTHTISHYLTRWLTWVLLCA